MVGSVPIQKLVHGLRIITPDEISQISPSKLKIVLKYGNKINSYLLKINLRGNLKKTKISNFSTVFRYHY